MTVIATRTWIKIFTFVQFYVVGWVVSVLNGKIIKTTLFEAYMEIIEKLARLFDND